MGLGRTGASGLANLPCAGGEWYFAALVGWAGFRSWWETGLLAKAAAAGRFVVIPALLSVALLGLLAWLAARSTVYTLTQQRLVMRFGVVSANDVQLPFTVIERRCRSACRWFRHIAGWP